MKFCAAFIPLLLILMLSGLSPSVWADTTSPSTTDEMDINDYLPDTSADWLWLKSGEFLIGKVENLYDEKLEFDSDDLGVLKIKWKDIAQFHSRRLFSVRTVNNGSLTGRINFAKNILTVHNTRSYDIPQDEVITLIAGRESGSNIWASKFGLGANISKGNTEKLEYNSLINVSRQTTTSRIKTEYTGVISKADDVDTDEKHQIKLTYDVYTDKRLILRPLDLTLLSEPLQNIKYQINTGLGLGYQLIDKSGEELEVNIGPSYLYTRFDYPDQNGNEKDNSTAVSFGTTYEKEINKRVDMDITYKLTSTDKALGEFIQNSNLKFAIELTDILDLDVSFLWDRVTSPLLDIDGNALEQNDFKLIFGLAVKFD